MSIQNSDYTQVTQQIRLAGQSLTSLPVATRINILTCLAEKISKHKDDILQVNRLDIDTHQDSIDAQLLSRLRLTDGKIQSLIDGILQVTTLEDPIDQVLSRMEISPGLHLEQRSVPLGVILIIFEARPEVLCQCAALAIFSGNGLLLKGGSEAHATNQYLHQLTQEAIVEGSQGMVDNSLITLITTREAVADLLKLDKYIDLVIPRGSSQLVRYCQQHSLIPVMGHSEGICHVYLDSPLQQSDSHLDSLEAATTITTSEEQSAHRGSKTSVTDTAMYNQLAMKIIRDSKMNYPSACNALEVLVLHRDTIADQESVGSIVLSHLQTVDHVKIYPTRASYEAYPILHRLILPQNNHESTTSTDDGVQLCDDPHHEYGDLSLTLHVCESIEDAIQFINLNSSKHTESIITLNMDHARQFTRLIDSSSVFINASTRFADGHRFGLGCEVGISTSKLHARGPVGIKGLTTTKYIVNSCLDQQVQSITQPSEVLLPGHTVTEFVEGLRAYTHKPLDKEQ